MRPEAVWEKAGTEAGPEAGIYIAVVEDACQAIGAEYTFSDGTTK